MPPKTKAPEPAKQPEKSPDKAQKVPEPSKPQASVMSEKNNLENSTHIDTTGLTPEQIKEQEKRLKDVLLCDVRRPNSRNI
jgi:hypothetical protein